MLLRAAVANVAVPVLHGDGALAVPALAELGFMVLSEGEFEDVLTGARHRGGATPMAALLAEFPVALLLRR